MSLYFVTGIQGAGKSTACELLRERGYLAYDTDADDFARWTNLETGYVHPGSSIGPKERTPEFLKTHSWQIPRPAIERLHSDAENKLVFLCGWLDNLDKVSDLFNGIIALYIDGGTTRNRLADRVGNAWGVQEHEVRQSLENHHDSYDTYRAMGAVIVDAMQPQDQVIDNIIAAATSFPA